MNRKLSILFVLSFVIQSIFAQSETAAGPPTQAVHNAAKYNRFLFNPAFSFDRVAADSGDKNGYISVYGRLEKIDFDDAPRNINATYSKTLNENMSFGGGLFQQNIGVISHFGGVLNYTYNVEFNRDTYVAFGANVSYQRVGLKSELRTTGAIENNSLLGEFEGTSLLRVTPGVNLNYKNFDFGITARNIISASLGGNQNTFKSNTIVVHGMYSRPFARRSPNTFRGMLYVEKETALDPVVGVNGFVENSKYGFAQLGYNQTFGVSLGLGFNVTPQATIAYTVERGLGDADVFGLNHEFTLAYNFVEPQRRGRRRTPSKPKAKRKLPKRNELSKAEKIIALREAREQNKTKLATLQEAKAKAALLRTTKLKEAEEKDKASELVRTVSLQINDNSLEKAKATLERIKNSKYISEDDKKSLLARYTKKLEISQDIEEEKIRIAEETNAKNEARATLKRVSKFLDEENVTDAQSTLTLIKSSKYVSPEEKKEITARLQRIIQQKEATRIASLEAEERKKGAELVRSTTLLLEGNNIEEAKNRASLIRQNKFIPTAEKEKLLASINQKVKENEQAIALEEKRKARGAELVRSTNLLLDEENTVAVQNSIDEINQNKYIPESEKKKILSRLQRIVKKQEEIAAVEEAKKISTLKRIENEKNEEAVAEKLAEEQRLASEQEARRTLLSETEVIIAEGSLEEAKARATLVRSSTLIPAEEKDRILSSLTRIIVEKETAITAARQAEDVRLAEEQRLASEQEARRTLVSETEEIIAEGSLEDAKARATLVRTSTLIPAEEKDRILSTLTRVIVEKEAESVAEQARIAEEQRLATEEAARQAEQARIAEEQRLATEEAARQAEQARIAEEQRLAAEEAARQAEQARIAEEQSLAAEEAARQVEQARIEEEQRLATEEAARQAEQARIAEEQRLAAEEAARQAEQAQKLVAETEVIVSEGSLEEAKARATLIRTSTLIPAEEKDRILSSLKGVIVEKEAEKARLVEQAQKEAEERQALITETEAIISEGNLEETKARATLIRTSTLIPAEEKDRILSSLKRVIVEKEAVEAKKIEEQRLAAEEAARQAEQARIAEEQRLAAEEAARQAEQARIAKEQRLAAEEAARQAEQARIAEEQRLAAEEAARQAEQARIAEEQRLAAEEAARQAEQARIAEEQRLAAEEAARQAEQARIAEEQRLAAEEAARQAEQARIAEEQRLAAEEAARQAEQARIAEEQRLAAEEAARQAEQARIAEEQRLAREEAARIAEAARLEEERRKAEAIRIAAEEEASRKAEQARIAEEIRLAEEARLEQERLAKEAEEANKKKATITRTTTTIKEEVENKKRAELVRVKKIISDEDQKEERRKAVQAALKRTTKKVEKDETGRTTTLKRTLLPQQGSENNRTNSNGMGLNSDIIEQQQDFFAKELFMQPQINIKSKDVIYFIDALVKSKSNQKEITNDRIIDLDKKKRLLKTKLKMVKTSEK